MALGVGKFMSNKLLALVVILVTMVGYAASADGRTPIDQVPMYGGVNRNADPVLREGDEALIRDTSNHYGSRPKASMAFVETAFNYYYQNNLDYAMRRFNQAWLIDPKNPEVYWGFASVLHDRGEYCEALRLLELGLSKGQIQSGHKPDHAVITAACGRYGESLTSREQEEYYQRSEELFLAAELDPLVPRPYLYLQWVRKHYALGDYEEAWKKVREHQRQSKEPFDSNLLQKLSVELAEPK